MPTALELRREGWRNYVEKARQHARQWAPDQLHVSERSELLERVRDAAQQLKQKFPVKRIVLFGSLAHQGWSDTNSDVDLAIEGLRASDYWDAWRLLEEELNKQSVDLVEIETAGAALRQSIDRYGLEL